MIFRTLHRIEAIKHVLTRFFTEIFFADCSPSLLLDIAAKSNQKSEKLSRKLNFCKAQKVRQKLGGNFFWPIGAYFLAIFESD